MALSSSAIIVLLLAGVVAISGCTQAPPAEPGPSPQPTPQPTPTPEPEPEPTPAPEDGVYIVDMTSDGFSPKILTIKNGDTVKWVNRDTAPHWPASAVHPTHRIYPGSGIEQCDEPDAVIFDACGGIAQGESFSFIFDYEGAWVYHDHLNSRLTGSIVVGPR